MTFDISDVKLRDIIRILCNNSLFVENLGDYLKNLNNYM